MPLFKRAWTLAGLALCTALLGACNGGDSAITPDAPPTTPVVTAVPTITAAPESVSTLDGTSATLIVTATGDGSLTYRWQRNGADIADATASSYTTPALTLADTGGTYTVIVSNAGGSVTSTVATVTVNPVPAVVATEPQDATVVAGKTVTFDVTATGSAPITYQWLRNGTAIDGATAASYVTPATALADDGTLYSVVVTNAGGTATSRTATLTVAPLTTAPLILSAPASVTVAEGQTATFTVTASGVGSDQFTYQWLRNGAAISGATATTYTTPALTVAADNGAKYSVRVTNATGNVTSLEAVLTVQAATSPLANRAWTTGQLLEVDDNKVVDSAAGIDDSGNSTVVFLKSNGTRNVLYATSGVPNASGQVPTWSTPVAIDVLNGVPLTVANSSSGFSQFFDVQVAPSGNALAYWTTSAPCTASSYITNPSENCLFLYSARLMATTGAWDAPSLVTSLPSKDVVIARFNDHGDIAFLVSGWERSGASSYTRRPMAVWQPSGANTFQTRVFNDAPLDTQLFGMDGAGNMLLAAEASQNATTDLVVYRGTTANGFGTQNILDTRGDKASLSSLGVGVNGQQVVVWRQTNDFRITSYGATAATPTADFSVVDLNYTSRIETVAVSDAGQAIVMDLGGFSRFRWNAASGWSGVEKLPSKLRTSNFVLARNGNLLQVDSYGTWQSYDATFNVLTVDGYASPNTYVLGLSTGAGFETPTLSVGGIGLIRMQNTYDVLPTLAKPTGDGRNVTNLWGAYLK